MHQASKYDIDRWDPTSLTWKPHRHSDDIAQAKRLATWSYGREKTTKFRVRRKSDGLTLFEISSQGAHDVTDTINP